MPKAPRRETRENVEIRRISSVRILRSRGKVGRLLTEVLGAITMALVALRHRRKIDLVFCSIPPFFYSIPGLAMKRLGRKPMVLDIRDLWLDWAEETALVRSRLVMRILRALERAVVGAADHITLATEGFRAVLIERYGVPADRATVVFNGLDDRLAPGSTGPAPTREAGDRVRVLYAGNLGPSQNLLGIKAGLLQSLNQWSNLEITIVGDGSQREELASLQHERLHLLPHVDRDELARLYRKADAFLIHLADLAVYRHTVPSKVFEYVAYGRPILCGVKGEARAIAFRHADCFAFESDDSRSLASAVDRLCSDEDPDNVSETRAHHTEILRSSRAPVWRRVFEGVR